MKKTNPILTFTLSGIPRGSKLHTERGIIEIENLRVSDTVLTENQTFQPVVSVKIQKAHRFMNLSVYGLETAVLYEDSKIYVRDVIIKEKNGETFPMISWPYWVSVKDLNPLQHLVLSPLNPHRLNRYGNLSIKDLPVSCYQDSEGQIWLPIQKVEHIHQKVQDVYEVEVTGYHGIAANGLAIQ